MKIHEAKINKLHAASALTSGFFFLFAKDLLQVPLLILPHNQEKASENSSHLVAAKNQHCSPNSSLIFSPHTIFP